VKRTTKQKPARSCVPRDPIEFEDKLPIRKSSPAWRACIKAFYGTPLTPDEVELFRELSGLELPPEGGADEFEVIAGRRSGKSEAIGRVAVFEGRHGGHEVALAPGQIGVIAVVSPLREQSQEVLGFVKGLARLKQVKRFVERETTDGVRFTNGIEIRVTTADALNVSGPTIVCAIRDEHAKFPGDDAAMSDRMIDDSLRPALAPLAGAPRRRLIGITSSYIKSGVAFETDRDNFGKVDAPVLVVRGSTQQFNPSIDSKWLARERRRVGARVFAREYLAEWADAITTGWFGVDVIDACVERGIEERPPVEGVRYICAVDPAFKGDMFAVSFAHGEERGRDKLPRLVLDACTAWKASRGGSLDVETCIADVAALCEEYNVTTVYTDQHGYPALENAFERLTNLTLIERPWTSSGPEGKAVKFRAVRDAMVSRRVRLLDNRDLLRQFHSIQGELLRSGGERIEARAGHDDMVDATVLALFEAGANAGYVRSLEIVRKLNESAGSWRDSQLTPRELLLERCRNETPGFSPLSVPPGAEMFPDGHGNVVVGFRRNKRTKYQALAGSSPSQWRKPWGGFGSF
jgi:hypothetical protein